MLNELQWPRQPITNKFSCLTQNSLLSVRIVYYDSMLHSQCVNLTRHIGLHSVILTFCNFWTFEVKTGHLVRGRINKELSLSMSSKLLQTAEQIFFYKSQLYRRMRNSQSAKCVAGGGKKQTIVNVKHICIIDMRLREVNVPRWMDFTKLWYWYGQTHIFYSL